FVHHPVRSAAYKQFGNAVPVPVVREVTRNILGALKEYDFGGQIVAGDAVEKHGRGERQRYQA
ncbi:MAG: DNA cytosine methyltransferase, partial [Parvibaculum sp.]